MKRRSLEQSVDATVISMKDYLLERRLALSRHHNLVLGTFKAYESTEVYDEYVDTEIGKGYAVKMGNLAVQQPRSQHDEDRFPVDYDEWPDHEP